MKVTKGKYEGHQFFYIVTYSINDMQGQSYYHEEVFINDDLHIARENAFEYFNSRVEWAHDKNTQVFNQLTAHSYNGFEAGKHFAFGPAIEFVNFVGEDEEYRELIVDGDPGNITDEVIESRSMEEDVYCSLGLKVPAW